MRTTTMSVLMSLTTGMTQYVPGTPCKAGVQRLQLRSHNPRAWQGSSNSITGVLGQAWGLASGTADRLVAFGMDIAPEGTSRPVVRS